MNLIDRKQDLFINSELDLKMLASHSFDKVIDFVKQSNLNFQIQLSPFSAIISLKKSYIKNINGIAIAS